MAKAYLLLFVKGGSHSWRLDYTINGRRKRRYRLAPTRTGLKLAREKADEARRLVAAGIDGERSARSPKPKQCKSARPKP